MTEINALKKIFTTLTDKTVILTPNRRLAATLHQYYQHHQLESGNAAWLTPQILPINTWLQQLWTDYTYSIIDQHPTLLSSTQETYLWEKIIAESPEHTVLLQISDTADIAKSAWGLLKQWQVSIHHPAFNASEDYISFKTWAHAFDQYCRENNYLDSASLPDFLYQKITDSKITLPTEIYLVGFNEISPQLKSILKTATPIDLAIPNKNNHRTAVDEIENEIYAMARWAKQLKVTLEEAKIGCVIPMLDKMRDRVAQIFSEVFAEPGSYTVNNNAMPFNISAGKTLIYYPLINIALTLLSLYQKRLSSEKLNQLLATPFIGDAESEYLKRAQFDIKLRQENIESIEIATLLDNSDDNRLSLSKQCPALAKRIEKYCDYINDRAAKSTFKQWAHVFNECVSLMGWPGERSINSLEFQVVDCWLKLLAEFTTFDAVSAPVDIATALKALQRLASTTSFQAKSPETNIQVLGMLEAGSIPFDYLWVSGMDDLSWPPQPKPNPFIPKHLQRELNMPHATAERELQYCQFVTNQFINNANHIIFSHAKKNDEIELQHSALIADINPIDITDISLAPFKSIVDKIHELQSIEKIADEIAPSHIGNQQVGGGVNVIRLQALCPFKAFSECRLHARELEKTTPGLRAKDRGTIVHQILQRIWNKLSDQTALKNLSSNELEVLVNSITKQILIENRATSQHKKRYLSLEEQRLTQLIYQWLMIEKERPYFKVLMNENAAEITLNQLTLSVRIDRIDEIDNNKKLIIDYKTGKNNQIKSWLGERPEEPQLPLYCLLDPDNTAGISFAQLFPGETCMKGMSQYALDIHGIKDIAELNKKEPISWQLQLTEWKNTLTTLADHFYNGYAHVNPKEKVETCQWCQLKPLCRINEEVSHT